MTLPLRLPLRSAPFPIIAELGNDRCAALDLLGRGEAPALDLCRKLVAAGHDPATPIYVYRQGVLALRIRTIGEGAQLEVTTSNSGIPVFRKRREGRVPAPPVAPIAPTLSEVPTTQNNAPTLAGDHAAGDDDIIARIERQQHERNDPGEPEPLETGGAGRRP